MFVYSGFANKSLENLYTQKLAQVIQILQTTLLKTFQYRRELIKKADIQGLLTSFRKVFLDLEELEGKKHFEPKFSGFCREIKEFCDDSSLACGRFSPQVKSKWNDFDFQILNDCLAFDNSRDETRVVRTRDALGHQELRKDAYVRSSRLRLDGLKDGTKRFTPMLRRSTPDKGILRYEKKKGRKFSPAQMYHDQAMALLYTKL